MPNLLILSPTNNGKTMLVKKFMRDYLSCRGGRDPTLRFLQKSPRIIFTDAI